jgi:hypothetical protein
MTRRALIAVTLGATMLATPAFAQDIGAQSAAPDQPQLPSQPAPSSSGRQVSIVPYIEVGQLASADLSHDDGVLTYTQVGGGVDASVQTRRVQAQVNFQYDHLFAWAKHEGDEDIYNGLARANVAITPALSIEAGGLATRAHSDTRGASPGFLLGDVDNSSEVYSAYVGPTLATHLGDASVNAAYRFGYTKVGTPGPTDVGPNQPALDYFDHSTTQLAAASVGVRPGAILPFGVTVSGGWERDVADQLDQRYDDKFVRGDVVQPISRTIALTAGVGYEKLTVTQKDAELDADGQPVVDNSGRYVTDQASPRRIAYQTDGLIYDAGVIWRPSPRTSLTVTAAHRYGTTIYTGTFNYAVSQSVNFNVDAYDGIETFGHQLQDSLASLPTSFVTERDALMQQFSGCVFGTSSSATGGCLNSVFQSLSSATYRARGFDAMLSAQRGGTSFGVGLGYASRRFYSPADGPDYAISGITDRSWYADVYLARALSRNQGINADLFVNYYNSGVAGASSIVSTGLTGTYYHNFGRLSTTASVGIYSFSGDHLDDDVQAQGLLGARYSF